LILGYDFFKKRFFDAEDSVYTQFLETLLNDIEKERLGDLCSDEKLLKNCVHMFIELGQTAEFISNESNYYSTEKQIRYKIDKKLYMQRFEE